MKKGITTNATNRELTGRRVLTHHRSITVLTHHILRQLTAATAIGTHTQGLTYFRVITTIGNGLLQLLLSDRFAKTYVHNANLNKNNYEMNFIANANGLQYLFV